MSSPVAHIAVEIERGDTEACSEFYSLLGFVPTPVPAELSERTFWLERDGVQLHLLFSGQRPAASSAHFAVVVSDYEETFSALEAAGHRPEQRKQYWGSPRAYVRDPAGNLVEFMAHAPQ